MTINQPIHHTFNHTMVLGTWPSEVLSHVR